jgi:NAD-dependent SIR2 family protein deacetylase
MFARHLYFPLGSDKRVEPSDSHKLLSLLEQKKMLLRVYTQNIDGLEQIAGVSSKRMVYAHGSLQWATCCKCQAKVSASEMESSILKGVVPKCQEIVDHRKKSPRSSPLVMREGSQRQRKRPRTDTTEVLLTATNVTTPTTLVVDEAVARCGGVLKPGVTFFGEMLHDDVRKNLEADRNKADALIVIGTSLSV